MTYHNLKTIIQSGEFDRDDLEKKIKVFLRGKKINQEEHDELIELMGSKD